jgi:hypothetical protein
MSLIATVSGVGFGDDQARSSMHYRAKCLSVREAEWWGCGRRRWPIRDCRFDGSPKAAPQPGDLERAIFSPMNQLAGLLCLSVGLR